MSQIIEMLKILETLNNQGLIMTLDKDEREKAGTIIRDATITLLNRLGQLNIEINEAIMLAKTQKESN